MDLGPWDPMGPSEATELFESFDARWWIAGGWAIELFAGVAVRSHDDLDIEISRADTGKLVQVMDGWDLQLASDGTLTPWSPSAAVPPGVNSIWCRPDADSSWRVQVMFAPVRDQVWSYRRDERVHRPLTEIVFRTEAGIPALVPEVQLLYKSAYPRQKDEIDLRVAWDRMTDNQRRWLLDALNLVSPGHPWLAKFACKDLDA